MRVIVIDDERTLWPSAEHYRTSAEGLLALQDAHARGERIRELWLDHDLGEDDSSPYGFDTIMPVVRWLEEMGHARTPLLVDVIFVHTSNASAAPAMMDALRPYYRTVRAVVTGSPEQ